MDRESLLNNLKTINGIVAVSLFGSYGSEFWIKDRSDIDIAVVLAPEVSFMNTLDMEDVIMPIFQDYFSYDNIHLTFIFWIDFPSKYARMATDSQEVYVVDENLWYDFKHYVCKYARNNREFERRLKIDEQFTYFGGIIDESLL